MNIATSYPSALKQVSLKTTDRMNKIRQLIGRAINQVLEDKLQTTNLSPSQIYNDEYSQAESIRQILSNLRRGYLMVKYSQGCSEPQNKFLYLSEDMKYLSWKSLDKADEKRIQICSIVKVVKEGVQFYLKGTTKDDLSRFIIVISEQRNLQLQARTEMQAIYFKYELQKTIKHSGCMHLNYKYSKI